jgi:hypothetical protein
MPPASHFSVTKSFSGGRGRFSGGRGAYHVGLSTCPGFRQFSVWEKGKDASPGAQRQRLFFKSRADSPRSRAAILQNGGGNLPPSSRTCPRNFGGWTSSPASLQGLAWAIGRSAPPPGDKSSRVYTATGEGLGLLSGSRSLPPWRSGVEPPAALWSGSSVLTRVRDRPGHTAGKEPRCKLGF